MTDSEDVQDREGEDVQDHGRRPAETAPVLEGSAIVVDGVLVPTSTIDGLYRGGDPDARAQ